ncbi:unnamed protein product [Heterosigma akashiwo]|mmetsp:Transcript_8820/g.13984  ORF Transcript_8820/g.13984 Transcript_8820/m.13984 type:complete len:362 (-) Transcript_8820:215-1300(-)
MDARRTLGWLSLTLLCLLSQCLGFSVPQDGFSTGTVVVAGANGRVGRFVVQELLTRPNATVSVTAAVRDPSKAKNIFTEILSPGQLERVKIKKCDLGNQKELAAACEGADAAIWCASGFSDQSSPINRALALFKVAFTPKESLDIAAIRNLGAIFAGKENGLCPGAPQVVLCSSAGVTRPDWPEDKKLKYPGAADIPIVRLNPLGILGVKAQGEEALRRTGAAYAVVRPCGLNDQHPAGRPVLSQGDMAVGRTSRRDAASLLAAMLFEPGAAGKTFEAIAVAGLPKPRSYADQLGRLLPDGEAVPEAALLATYALLQQLVPGETLAPEQLAMGQTYEQLDRGEQGRLGARGAEAPPIVQEQ